jgi:outer membrane autotransporter protein
MGILQLPPSSKASSGAAARSRQLCSTAMALLLGAGLASAQAVSVQAQVIGDITQVLPAGPSAALDLAATGDILIDGVDAIVTATGLPGVSAIADGSVTATVLDVTTTGGSAPGVLIDAAEVDLVTGGLVSTTGDDSAAVSITSGGPVTVDSALLNTAGVGSNGVEIVSVSGPTLLDADVIDTTGDRSLGALVQAAGDVDVDIGVLRTEGAEAAGVSLTTDPAACVVLGTGACDINGTLGDIATGGLLAPGALVRAAGDIGLDVGVLRTAGDEAVGLDLATSPTACATLGPGGCDTAFSVADLQTLGVGSTGALVRATGLTTADVGVLRTGGDDAVGLDIAADPAACVLLGSGGCDVSATIDELTTEGANAVGVLVRAPADIGVDAGIVRTLGDNAAAVDLAADPAACILLGAGACDTFLAADEISTAGDGSPGALIRAGGPVTATVRQLRTLGLASPGLDLATDPLVCATLGAAACAVTADVDDGSTGGGDSDVVDVDNDGPTDVDVENGSTSGDGSSVVDVDGGAGPVVVDVENGSTSGANAPVIEVTTTTGDQTIGVGTVAATGPGSDAIDATSDTGDIAIAVREEASSTDDAAIDAFTDGRIDIDVLPGAVVRGDEAAIDIHAGAGSTIDNAGTISADDGLAIDADGGSTVIGNTGTIVGRVDLTPAADVFNNGGTFDAAGTSDFGAGADVFNNTGRLRARGAVFLAGLETFNNAGLIDMVDDATDDSLTLPGGFNGQAGSRLAVDANLSAAGTPADRLIVGGAVTGTTTVAVNNIGGPDGVLNPDGVVIVDAASAPAGAFVLDEALSAGFVDYTLETDAATGDLELVGRPGQSVFDLASVGALSQAGWYRSSDLVSDHGWRLRAGAVGGAAPHGWQLWGQASDDNRSRDSVRTFDAFGTPVTASAGYDQSSVSIQFGADTLRPTANGQAYAGVTFGIDDAEADLGALSELDTNGWNLGVYGGWFGERAWIDGVLKVDRFDLEMTNRQIGYTAETDGKSYGAQVQAGYRFGDADFHVEPVVTLAYVRTSIDGLTVGNSALDFDDGKSMRGKAGVRIGRASGDYRPYAMVEAVKEFEGDNVLTFGSGGFSTTVDDEAGDAYGLATIGLERAFAKGGVFFQAQGAFGEVEGYSLRLGARASW